ncbi:hypothetical protein TNCV_2160621 [Trichonephila clavipes]|nr:hypothetical protein TNCV_2160621 [Trichonephila clavipes]
MLQDYSSTQNMFIQHHETQNIKEAIFWGYFNYLVDATELQDNIDKIPQLDGASPHWSVNVLDYPDEHLPHRWIGRGADLTNGNTEFLTEHFVISSCGDT